MSDCLPCKALADCLQFHEFGNDNVEGTCPNGNTAVVQMPSGVSSFTAFLNLGHAPYPDLVLNCTGGIIRVPVPDNTTQIQFDELVEGMINKCLNQMAINIGCVPQIYYNTQQQLACPSVSQTATLAGGIPAGISGAIPVGGTASPGNLITIPAGLVQSTVSVVDANNRALQVLTELFATGNITCV